MEHIYDLIIIGAGPAGLSAAIYAKRAMLDFLIIEKWFPGGEIANTFEVENYLGVNRLSGMDLANNMVKHVEDLGVEITVDPVTNVDFAGEIKKITTEKTTYLTKTVIIASGASARKLSVNGENRLTGYGVSYCATCDGFLYKDKVVAVVGGGDVAVEDAIYLSRIVKKVYLVHRRDQLRAVKALQERMFNLNNVEVIWDSTVEEISGSDFVENITVKNKLTQETKKVDVNGVFIAVGHTPNIDFLDESIELIDGSWIKTNEFLETNVPGVFAAGDIRDTHLRQIVMAVSDGALAVSSLLKYL
ncbi:MAG: thioredoxin-disulfide reductase [Candidatus Izemoplasmatales bacterium]|nr:thioredoxin-disulfide reductase [Candidatus Izemoplasmatales bacterium]